MIKKILLFVMGFLFLTINVEAANYKTLELIPIDTSANVITDVFEYTDLKYNSDTNPSISFSSIKNISKKKAYVSINVLLFDSYEKNIGIVTYCTKNDYDSDNNYLEIYSNESIAFSIAVRNSYLADSSRISLSEVKYIAVLDDNSKCNKGGYALYEGLTVDDIANNYIHKDLYADEDSEIDVSSMYYKIKVKIKSMLNDLNYINLIMIGLFVLISLFIYGFILNILHDKIYDDTTFLSYLPITNIYITIKLAFGKIFGLVYVLLCLVSCFVYATMPLLPKVLILLVPIAFLIDIIKIITRKYKFLPTIKKTRKEKVIPDEAEEPEELSLSKLTKNDNNESKGKKKKRKFFNSDIGKKEEKVDKDITNDEESDLTKMFK